MGLERRDRVRQSYGRNNWKQEDAGFHTTGKPFNITKKQVYEAYKAVKSNAGSAGVDGQTIRAVYCGVKDLRSNLYKLWNRIDAPGSYFPPPVLCRLHSQKDWRPAADFRCCLP